MRFRFSKNLSIYFLFLLLAPCFGQMISPKKGIINLLEYPPRWGFQVRGEKPRYMPPYWYGRYEETGADCYPQMREGDLTPWFLHPPWRGVTGETFAEWELNLPNLKPIKLHLRVALARGALPASDGVIFKILFKNRGQESLVSQIFVRSEEWIRKEIDISQFAGKKIVLKVVVNPGEKWNTTNDWARLGELKLIVGNEEEARKIEEMERLAKRKAIIERYGEKTADMSKFWGINANSPRPSSGFSYSNKISKNHDGSYSFIYEGKDCKLAYIFKPPFSSLENLHIIFNGKEIPQPTFGGGVSLFLKGEVVDWSRKGLKREVAIEEKGGTVREKERWEFKGEEGLIDVEVKIEGKSLILTFSSAEPKVSSINIAVSPQRHLFIPFLYEGLAQVAYVEPVFLSSFCDWWKTKASSIGGDGSSPTYIPKTNGERNPAFEIFYLTVSPYLEEVLPNIPNPPSPYLKELSGRLVLDVWSGKFADDREYLKELEKYGVNSLLVIKHDWQREGYDNAYPTTMPANKALGGDEELRKLCEEAKRIGHRFCVHENYYDYYPNSEAFRKEDVALDPAGNLQKGWFNASVPIQALILKPSKFLHYEKIFSPEIKRRYDVNAGYFDIMPSWNVDYDANAEGAAMISYTHTVNTKAYALLRDTYGGPVVCEGSDFTEAGYYDGGSNYGLNRRQIPMLPIFELLKVHPLMLNHGMGYYERWLIDGYSDPGWYQRVMTEEERDEYRMMTLAFGRIGFLGHQLMYTVPGLLKEYFLTLPIQRSYGAYMPKRILYEIDGKWVSSSGAALLNEMNRMLVEYENGTKLYLNRGKADWKVGDFIIPQYGFLAKGVNLLAYTAKRDNVIADYAEDEWGIFCDARTETYIPTHKRIFPSVSSFKDLGKGRFQISYRWVVEDEPRGEFVSFVHFIAPGANKIAFQQDHSLPTPTSQWKKGMKVEDGPYTIQVPENAEGVYLVYLGLYNENGRVLLGNGKDSFLVGKLEVKRDEGKISLKFHPELPEDITAKYTSRLNKERKIVDFGKVLTDGCLRIEKREEGLLIIPIPMGRECFISLRLNELAKGWEKEKLSLIAYGSDGKELGEVKYELTRDLLSFRTNKEAGFYFLRY
ncbi:hypothetical protein H5T87_01300 [bacterium]|nr:hypothetical protein [bacterium]